ncbi:MULTISPECIES: arylesterase [unclassified Imperialibacter]|uniref:arylesterase n=1 Tax=unclassified Imperialibacter TaxID=2629706 RepID=UPI001254D90C|nr:MULTISPECIES: arylesterase [unclassified Imperialibacter]CAD5247982.1 Arylesterase [Imperialibacter sp. 75]CAD5248102.1 Arylesterase [Imperialibacter sp. 89]VVS97360.1 Arylesterase [Imperialibacter sp. EC-SDR9]
MIKSILGALLLVGVFACDSIDSSKQTTSKEKVSEADVASEPAEDKRKVILFYGNSITAGYGLDISEAFPAIIQERLDSLGYDYNVINAGLSGETSAGGLSRIDWVLKTPVDIFALELGGNDGLRGISLDETEKNLSEIIEKVKQSNPQVKIIVAGMQIPPNMGQEYTDRFRGIFPALAEKHNTALIPFILEGVGGIPELNLPDGIHPTPEGHKMLADNVWAVLEPIIDEDNI